jgi:hypothetical protein
MRNTDCIALIRIGFAWAMQGRIKMVRARQSAPSLFILYESVPFARDARNPRKRAWVIDKAENVERKLYG